MTDILSIADNIFQYVNNVYMNNDSVNDNNSNFKNEDAPTTTKESSITSTKEIMKELINMEQTNKTGGVAIDDVMNNFTGGNVAKTKNKKHIFEPVTKQLDQNLFEGGDNENKSDESINELKNDENKIENKNNESINNNIVESVHEMNDDSDSDEEEMIKNDIIVYNKDEIESLHEYEKYLKQLDDEDIPQQKNMKGGNIEKNNFETLSMFPYFIKY